MSKKYKPKLYKKAIKTKKRAEKPKFDQSKALKPIIEIAKKINLTEQDLEFYGKYKAKINHQLLKKLSNKKDGKLILVTAITPTSAGEGKTTTTIGLGESFSLIKQKAIICLRQSSMGPVFGIKGGAAGGGCSEVIPMEDINMHFTGDIHAVSTATNLIAAVLDNHIFQGNKLGLEKILIKRAIDMNDRALRNLDISSSGKFEKTYRTEFQITAASEIMAILAMSADLKDLKKRVSNMVVALDYRKKPITVKDMKIEGAVAAILKDAINPNLVQTMTNTPAFIHAGPFGNIAHGCSSAIATKLALKLADYVVTEAGFGSDLGMEKFFDIKSRIHNLSPAAVVLVVTVKALKMHGGVSYLELSQKNVGGVSRGLVNLEKHIENVKKFKVPFAVALNKYENDTDEEIDLIQKRCKKLGINLFISEVHDRCGPGAVELANELIKITKKNTHLKTLYQIGLPIKEKIKKIAKNMYGAEGIDYTEQAEQDIEWLEQNNFRRLPICMAKTQKSLSDNPQLLGRPVNFKITISSLKVSAGAGFIVAFAGEITTMPGLPKEPAAENVDISDEGEITGLF